MKIAQVDFDGTLIRNNIGVDLMLALSSNLQETIKAIKPSCDFNTQVAKAWSLVKVPQVSVLTSYAFKNVKHWDTSEHISSLFKRLRERGYSVRIVSNGIKEYIAPFIEDVTLICSYSEFSPEGIRVVANVNLKSTFTRIMPIELVMGDSPETDLESLITVIKRGGKAYIPATQRDIIHHYLEYLPYLDKHLHYYETLSDIEP